MTRVAPNSPDVSPLKLLFTLAALILAAETLVMFLLKLLALDSPLGDAVILTALLSLPLYLFVFRPMAHQMAEHQRAVATLAESEARTRQIIEGAVDAFIAIDARSVITDWNPVAETIFGWSRAEALGRNLNDMVIPPQMQEAHRSGLAHFLATGEGPVIGKRLELMARRRDGHELPVEITISAIRAGDSWRFTAFIHDITQRRKLEAGVRRSESRYRALFESSRDAIMTLEPPSWKFTSGNPVAVAMFRTRNAEHFVALGPWELSPERQPDGRASDEKAKEMIETAMRNGSHFFEWTHRRFDGEAFPTTVLLSKMEIDKTIFLQATVRDITERKRAEDELLEKEHVLSESQRLGHVGSWFFDGTGKVSWSDEMYRLYGVSRDTFTPTIESLISLIHPDDRPAMQAWIVSCEAGKKPDILEFRIKRPDSTVRFIRGSGDVVFDIEKRFLHMAGTAHDITERKQAEEALRAKNKELEQVIYAVSHDLRSPLVTIQTFLSHLHQDISAQDAAHVAKDFNFIQTATGKMGQSLDELAKLLCVRHQATPPESMPLQGIVKEVLGLVAGRISQLGVPVTVLPEAVSLYGDRAHFVAIFQNLVDNACKFMGDQRAPQIEIGVETRGAETVFFVRDNGGGIDSHRQAEMFGLFVRSLNLQVEGTGLGLALVKRIVELYGGRIWVESAGLGQGACFYFTLPRGVKKTNEGKVNGQEL